jgi:hypothetical protein
MIYMMINCTCTYAQLGVIISMVDLDLHDVKAKAMFDSNKSPNFMFTKSQKKIICGSKKPESPLNS